MAKKRKGKGKGWESDYVRIGACWVNGSWEEVVDGLKDALVESEPGDIVLSVKLQADLQTTGTWWDGEENQEFEVDAVAGQSIKLFPNTFKEEEGQPDFNVVFDLAQPLPDDYEEEDEDEEEYDDEEEDDEEYEDDEEEDEDEEEDDDEWED
jgi:hypothetical protein